MRDLVQDAVTRAAIAVDDLEMVTDALAARAMPFRGVERSQALTQGKRDALAGRIRAAAREAYRAAIAIETGLDVEASDWTYLDVTSETPAARVHSLDVEIERCPQCSAPGAV